MRKILHTGYAHAYHWVLEEGVFAGDNHVADPDQHQSASDAGAMHHGNRGFGQVVPTPAHAQIDLLLAHKKLLRAGFIGVVPPQALALKGLVDVTPRCANVVAGAEVFARTPQHNDFDRIIVYRAAKTGVQRIGHL